MAYRTPKQIHDFIEKNQFKMDAPFQYYGDEPNSYLRDWDKSTVKACIFACWAYEQAAGNQAIPLVYRVINEQNPEYLCDRSYFHSTVRDLRMFVKGGIPVFGVESKHQLKDFDMIGTSISYPVLSINFIKQLMMSDIPPTWGDRMDNEGNVHAGRHQAPEKYPFVLVGGQAYGAPEVIANIADCVFCGEVEDEPGNPGLGAVMDRIDSFKKRNLWQTERMECYKSLAREFNFLYFPCFIDVHYGYEHRPTVAAALQDLDQTEVFPSKQVVGYSSNLPGMKVPVLKRIVKDLDSVPALDNPPLLYTDPGMGVGDAEVGRGCPAWCSFCALTYRQKPYRQRSVPYMLDFAERLRDKTGNIQIAPFSPDFPMHTEKKKLISGILEKVSDDVDASSMRVDDFIADPTYILLQAHGGMDAVTLGVEGNSQRMRDLVGKGSADEDIKEAVARGIRAGLKRFKLYMIASLPGEDHGDIYKILNLAKELADIRDSMGSQARLQFSWTPMLIEGNTPFQWFAPTTANFALGDVWEEFRDLKIEFQLGGKAKKDRLTYFQLSQRASREVGLAMVEAVADHSSLGCWGGAPGGLHEDVVASLKRRGFLNGIADCYDERQKHDMFGWEMVDQGINVELMWVTYQQMKEFLENTDSESYDLNFGDDYHGNEWIERCDTKCYGKTCGVCDPEDLKLRRKYIQAAADELTVDLHHVKVIDQKTVAMRFRAKVHKGVDKRFVMNDHFKYAIRRGAYMAKIPITKRTIKFSSDHHKHKDWTHGADYVEFGLTRKVTKAEMAPMVEAMNAYMKGESVQASIEVVDWTVLPSNADELRQDVDLSLFEMEVEVDDGKALTALDAFRTSDYVKMVFREESRHGGIQLTEVNAKEYVDEMWLVRQGHRLMVRMMVRGKTNPYLVYTALFNKKSWIDAAQKPAERIEAFAMNDLNAMDFFRPVCDECGRAIPVNLLDKPFSYELCPSCQDERAGIVLGKKVEAVAAV